MILEQIAQKVSEDTTAVIGFPVSISDENGYLIGVNDPSRLGLYDNLLAEVTRTKKLTYFNESAVADFPTIFPGVAGPIIVNDKVLGAVGIIGKTKEDEETKNYIRLVQNHIEMMCHEALRQEMKSLEMNALDTLLHYVLNYDGDKNTEDHIMRYGKMMGYDLNGTRVCLIVQITSQTETFANETTLQIQDEFIHLLKNIFIEKDKDLFGRLTFEQFCILKSVDDAQLGDIYFSNLQKKADMLNQMLKRNLGASAVISVGDPHQGITGMQASYRNALQTLESSKRKNGEQNFLNYNDLTNKLNIMVHGLPGDFFHHINHSFLPLLKKHNYEMLAITFITYCDNKFNLSTTARSLFIHRNSIIYRLNQISKITHIDIENFDHCMLLYLFIKKHPPNN